MGQSDCHNASEHRLQGMHGMLCVSITQPVQLHIGANTLTCCEGMLARVLAVVHKQLRSLAAWSIIASVEDRLAFGHGWIPVLESLLDGALSPVGPVHSLGALYCSLL